jgi:hypothetical protein
MLLLQRSGGRGGGGLIVTGGDKEQRVVTFEARHKVKHKRHHLETRKKKGRRGNEREKPGTGRIKDTA